MALNAVDYRASRYLHSERTGEGGKLPSTLARRFFQNLTDAEQVTYQFKLKYLGDTARIVGGIFLRCLGVRGWALQTGRILSDETCSSLVSVKRRIGDDATPPWRRYSYEWLEGVAVQGMFLSTNLLFRRIPLAALVTQNRLFRSLLLGVGGMVAEEGTHLLGSAMPTTEWSLEGVATRCVDAGSMMVRSAAMDGVPRVVWISEHLGSHVEEIAVGAVASAAAASGLLAAVGGGGNGRPELRDYQEEACDNTLRAIQEGKGNGLIVLPTGTGKTITFCEVARRIHEQRLFGTYRPKSDRRRKRAKRTLVLVHREELIKQIEGQMRRAFGDRAVGVVHKGQNRFEYDGEVIVASTQTLASQDRYQNLDPEEFGLVIVDEAHHIVADTYQTNLRYFGLVDDEKRGLRAPGKFLLGVTATPDRLDGVHIGITFNEEYENGVLFSKPLIWFIRRGYLLKPKAFKATTDADLSRVRVTGTGDYDEDDLGVEMSRGPVLASVVKAYEENCAGKKSLVFAAGVAHAKELEKRFNEGSAKPRAAAIWGTMDSDLGERGLRQKLIEQHKRGEIEILINYGILTEGYDDPGIEAIIVARPTMSRALYTQMVGRGLRPDPEHPDRTECVVVDVTGRRARHELDIDCARWFGVEYTTEGTAPMDVFLEAERLDEMLGDRHLRERVRERIVRETDEVSFVALELLRGAVMPLRSTLRDTLLASFEGDVTRVAWRLGIPESKLQRYLSGYLPGSEEVRRDFARSQEILGIPTERLVELCRQSKRDWNVSSLFQVARRLDEADKGPLPLEKFFSVLGLSWGEKSHPVTAEWSQMRTGEEEERLAYQLWLWGRRGVDLQEIETILARHDQGDYKRVEVQADLEGLVNIARRTHLKKEELLAEGRRLRLLQKLPRATTFAGFVKLCRSKGIYTGELRALAAEPRSDTSPFSDYPELYATILDLTRVDPGEKADIAAFLFRRLGLSPAAAYRTLTDYLISDQPAGERARVIDILVQRGIPLPLPEALQGWPEGDFLARPPQEYLAVRLEGIGIPNPRRAVPLFLDAAMSLLFRETVQVGEGARLRCVEIVKSALEPNEQERGRLEAGSIPLPNPGNERRWVAGRFGTTVEVLDQWAEMAHRYGIQEGDQSTIFILDAPFYDTDGTIRDPGGYQPYLVLRAAYLFQRVFEDPGGVRYDTFMTRAAEVAGRSPEQMEVWWGRIPNEMKIGEGPHKTTMLARVWLRIVVPAKNDMRWRRWGARDRQKQVREAFERGGYPDFDEVRREVASWDPAAGSQDQRVLIRILFDPAEEGGTSFRRPVDKSG